MVSLFIVREASERDTIQCAMKGRLAVLAINN